MRNPNNFGSVYKLKGRRHNPWAARITTGWETVTATRGKYAGQEVRRQTYKYIGYFANSIEARDALTSYRLGIIPQKSTITLQELYDEWRAVKYPKLSRSSQDNYKAAWLRVKHLSNEQFSELRTSHWQAAIDATGETLGLSSLEKIRALLSLLYGYALANDMVSKDYSDYIELPKREKQKHEVFTDLEIQSMRKKAKTVPWLDTVLIMIYTGMRVSEMLQLTKFNVDVAQGIIAGGIKTDAGKNRLVPIHPVIMPLIKNRLNEAGTALISRPDGKPISAGYYRKNYYYDALKAAKLPRRTPHACRHTFATRLDKVGADTQSIRLLCGHANYSFTADTYTHTDIAKLKQAISMIK